MKKVVDFLEANVQWVALGLGVAWVLWMAWAFAINRPVVVKIGNEEMAPGSLMPCCSTASLRSLSSSTWMSVR